MKIKHLCFTFCALMMATQVAAGSLANRPYLAARAGFDNIQLKADSEKEDKTAFAFLIGLGLRLRSFRAEIEWTDMMRSRLKSVRLEQQRYMLQTYYDLPIRSAFRPYLNLGAGAAYTEVSDSGKKDDRTGFAWNAGAGLGVNVTRSLSVDIGYRYVDSGKPKLFNTKVKARSHEGYLGTRFSF